MFRNFENKFILTFTILGLIFTGLCLSLKTGFNSDLLNILGSTGSLLAGAATCGAVYIAWKAKNEWFEEHHFNQKNQLIKKMVDIYIKGVKYHEFQHAISGLATQGIEKDNKSGTFVIPKRWEIQATKNLQDFNDELQSVIRLSLTVDLNNKDIKITNNLVNTIKNGIHALQFTDFTNINSIDRWNKRYSECMEYKEQFENSMRNEIISISNNIFDHSMDFDFLNLDTNFINIEQFIDTEFSLQFR